MYRCIVLSLVPTATRLLPERIRATKSLSPFGTRFAPSQSRAQQGQNLLGMILTMLISWTNVTPIMSMLTSLGTLIQTARGKERRRERGVRGRATPSTGGQGMSPLLSSTPTLRSRRRRVTRTPTGVSQQWMTSLEQLVRRSPRTEPRPHLPARTREGLLLGQHRPMCPPRPTDTNVANQMRILSVVVQTVEVRGQLL